MSLLQDILSKGYLEAGRSKDPYLKGMEQDNLTHQMRNNRDLKELEAFNKKHVTEEFEYWEKLLNSLGETHSDAEKYRLGI